MRTRMLVVAMLAMSGPALAQSGFVIRGVVQPSDTVSTRVRMDALLAQGRTDATRPQASAQMFRATFSSRVRSPFNQILQRTDSLQLTDSQADAIALLNRSFVRGLDSLFSPLAAYLAALPRDYNADQAWDSVRVAFVRAYDGQIRLTAPVRTVLTAPQMSALPASVKMLLDSTCIAKWRADPALPPAAC